MTQQATTVGLAGRRRVVSSSVRLVPLNQKQAMSRQTHTQGLHEIGLCLFFGMHFDLSMTRYATEQPQKVQGEARRAKGDYRVGRVPS